MRYNGVYSMKTIIQVVIFAVLGFAMACGMRLAEHLIDKPKVHILVCYDGMKGRCDVLDDLVSKNKSSQ
jgi:hypothetical protein